MYMYFNNCCPLRERYFFFVIEILILAQNGYWNTFALKFTYFIKKKHLFFFFLQTFAKILEMIAYICQNISCKFTSFVLKAIICIKPHENL